MGEHKKVPVKAGSHFISVCVECGESSKQALYRRFTGGAIQLTQCPHCKHVLDKYVEFDAVILLLDVLLLKIQTYRHLIFNYGITNSLLWKFCVVLVLCETLHTKLRMLGLEDANAVVLQVHFHTLFLQSIFELLSLLVISYILVKIVSQRSLHTTFSDVFRAVIISSFGKLTAIAAVVWTGNFYLWLPTVLVLPAYVQALRALISISLLTACVIVFIQSVLMYLLDCVLDFWRTQALVHLLQYT